jgi:hypothetical protein
MRTRGSDVPPDFRWTVLTIAMGIALAWAGIFNAIADGDLGRVRPARVGILMWAAVAIWLLIASFRLRSRN